MIYFFNVARKNPDHVISHYAAPYVHVFATEKVSNKATADNTEAELVNNFLAPEYIIERYESTGEWTTKRVN